MFVILKFYDWWFIYDDVWQQFTIIHFSTELYYFMIVYVQNNEQYYIFVILYLQYIVTK